MIHKHSSCRLRALSLVAAVTCLASASALAMPAFTQGWSDSGNGIASNGTGYPGMIPWSSTPATQREGPSVWREGPSSATGMGQPDNGYAPVQMPLRAQSVAYVPPPPGPYPVSPRELSEGASSSPWMGQAPAYPAASGYNPYPPGRGSLMDGKADPWAVDMHRQRPIPRRRTGEAHSLTDRRQRLTDLHRVDPIRRYQK